MLTELIQAATIIDSVVSERMKVYEASFKLEVKNAPECVFLPLLSSNHFIHLYVNYMPSKSSFLKNLIFFSMLFKPAATFLIFRHHLFHLIPERSRMIHNF